MFQRFLSMTFVTLVLATVGGCAVPMGQGQYSGPARPPVVDHFPEVQSAGAGVLCTVEVTRNGNTSHTSINVGSLRDCHKVGGFATRVQEVRNENEKQAPSSNEPQQKKLATYGKTATVRDGHTCAYLLNGEVVVDYFDKTRNPEGIELPSLGAGPRCQEMKKKFKTSNGLT